MSKAPKQLQQQKHSKHRVRIIGGVWRGRYITLAPSAAVRPTPNRVRETVFNWLQPVISGARCLDLFAGSGALGFEAASRGALKVILVERDPQVAVYISDQINRLHAQQMHVVLADAEDYLLTSKDRFDIVFLDPPFYLFKLDELLQRINSAAILHPGAQLYVEHAKSAAPIELPAAWQWWRRQQAGEVAFGLIKT